MIYQPQSGAGLEALAISVAVNDVSLVGFGTDVLDSFTSDVDGKRAVYRVALGDKGK